MIVTQLDKAVLHANVRIMHALIDRLTIVIAGEDTPPTDAHRRVAEQRFREEKMLIVGGIDYGDDWDMYGVRNHWPMDRLLAGDFCPDKFLRAMADRGRAHRTKLRGYGAKHAGAGCERDS